MQLFDCVHRKCQDIRQCGHSRCTVKITHDGYLKVAQLDGLQLPYDWVFIDEAQDLTACQAKLFWGNSAGKRTYLLGDSYQQIYAFRGASFAFNNAVHRSTSKKFTLTGSFRFGKNIAAYATCVLKALAGMF
jgi:superfamily I DNA/RNA helicase